MPTMTTDGPMRIPLTTTEMQDVLITLTTGFGLVASGQVEQISPLLQVRDEAKEIDKNVFYVGLFGICIVCNSVS